MMILVIKLLADIAVVKNPELRTLMMDCFQIERVGHGLLFVDFATGERLADGTDDGTLAAVVGIVVVAHAVTADEIGLILHGTSASKNLPGILTALGPVGYNDDGVVQEVVGIAAPNGEPQVVAGEQ